jgi:serine/threonine-protein phosphatase with EF-hands
LIQQWYRRYMARIEMKRRYTWTIFQSIEKSAEQDQVRLYNFFNDLITHMPKASKRVKKPDQISVASSELPGEDEMVDELDSYDEEKNHQKKPKNVSVISIPFEKKDIETLINLFRKRKYKLHARYVAQILRESIKRLKLLDNINKIATQGTKTVTVVGDLHGKLDDLLMIFYKVKLKNSYYKNTLIYITLLLHFMSFYRMDYRRIQIVMYSMVCIDF